jgi:hypothetical protein
MPRSISQYKPITIDSRYKEIKIYSAPASLFDDYDYAPFFKVYIDMDEMWPYLMDPDLLKEKRKAIVAFGSGNGGRTGNVSCHAFSPTGDSVFLKILSPCSKFAFSVKHPKPRQRDYMMQCIYEPYTSFTSEVNASVPASEGLPGNCNRILHVDNEHLMFVSNLIPNATELSSVIEVAWEVAHKRALSISTVPNHLRVVPKEVEHSLFSLTQA